MIDELVKTVRLHLSERLTSPLLGAFAVSWVAWNYRAVLVLLSAEPVTTKFQLLDTVVYPGVLPGLLSGVLYPLATSLAYIFLYPFPAKYVYEYSRNRQREILEIRRRIEEETPLTIEDSRRIRGEMARARQQHATELDQKDVEIESLKSQIASLQTTPAVPSSNQETNAQPQEEPLPHRYFRMLEVLAEADQAMTDRELKNWSGLDKVESAYALGEMERLGLVTRSYDVGREEILIDLTHDGRAALIAARLDANNRE